MTVRREIAQSLRETGARSREAGQRPAWSSEGDARLSGDFTRGLAPL